jgi:hypothetical protein
LEFGRVAVLVLALVFVISFFFGLFGLFGFVHNNANPTEIHTRRSGGKSATMEGDNRGRKLSPGKSARASVSDDADTRVPARFGQ